MDATDHTRKTITALSIRQPWAWLIMHAGKDIENRSWSTNYRGWFAIHAASGMTLREYYEARIFVSRIRPDLDFPAFKALDRGGIVGKARITGCVRESESPWFFGPFGFQLNDVVPLPFAPCKGALGFFGLDYTV